MNSAGWLRAAACRKMGLATPLIPALGGADTTGETDMQELSWPLILGLASTGIIMALASSLIGMRQRVEIPSWWALYAAWVALVLLSGNEAPFRTILISSAIAGVLHASTQSVLLDHYIQNNPWYSEQMNKPRTSLRVQFVVSGLLIGTGFGAFVAGIAWAIHRI